MELLGRDHVAQLAVLVGLAGLEGLVVRHGNRILEAGLEPRQIAEISRRRNGNLAAELLGIRCHGAEDDHTAGGVLRTLQGVQKQLDQEEMTEMVGGHGHLVTLRGTLRLLEAGLVDSGVADQGIDAVKRIDRTLDAVEIAEIHLHVAEPLLGDLKRIGRSGSTLGRPVRGHHSPSLGHQSLHRVQTHTGCGASHQCNAGSAGHQAISSRRQYALIRPKARPGVTKLSAR